MWAEPLMVATPISQTVTLTKKRHSQYFMTAMLTGAVQVTVLTGIFYR